MEAGACDVSEVTRKYPQRLVVICCPQTGIKRHGIKSAFILTATATDHADGCSFLPGHSVVSP